MNGILWRNGVILLFVGEEKRLPWATYGDVRRKSVVEKPLACARKTYFYVNPGTRKKPLNIWYGCPPGFAQLLWLV